MPTIRQLEALRAVMETGSISQAADVLLLTQPAVSKIVQGLEAETGLQLFTRERQRLVPTVEAHLLMNEVEAVLHSFSRVQRLARDLRSMALSNLTVAAMPAAGLYLLPKVLTAFQGLHPGFSNTLNIRSSPKVIELAIAQQFDVGFSLLPADHYEVRSIRILRMQAMVVVPPGNHLEGAASVSAEDLRGENLVFLGTDDRSAHLIDELFSRAGIAPRVVARADLSGAACEFVRQGAGAALIDPLTGHGHASEGLVRIPLCPELSFDLHLLLPLRRPSSLVRDRFLLHLHQTLSTGVPGTTYVADLSEGINVSA